LDKYVPGHKTTAGLRPLGPLFYVKNEMIKLYFLLYHR
jgi:hypothetical protein